MYPIETAPQDRPILVTGGEIEPELSNARPLTEWVKAKYEHCITYDSDCNEVGGWSVCDTCYYTVTVINPTHWCELPPTPFESGGTPYEKTHSNYHRTCSHTGSLCNTCNL